MTCMFRRHDRMDPSLAANLRSTSLFETDFSKLGQVPVLGRVSNVYTRRNSRIAKPEPQLGPHHCSTPSLQSTVQAPRRSQLAMLHLSSLHPVLAPTLSKAMSRRKGPSAAQPASTGRSAVRTKRAGEGFWKQMAWSIEPT
ncbi:hypothetical protein M758_2G233600 [Ceratodon purpureus]|nr:hypothetical protein M758_2G233600 [Ceratodon purpureus]